MRAQTTSQIYCLSGILLILQDIIINSARLFVFLHYLNFTHAYHCSNGCGGNIGTGDYAKL